MTVGIGFFVVTSIVCGGLLGGLISLLRYAQGLNARLTTLEKINDRRVMRETGENL